MSGDETGDSESSEKQQETVNSPNSAIEQYVQYVNLPLMIPRWLLGFHMLRWSWTNTSEVSQAHQKTLQADIPLEVIWSDITYLDSEFISMTKLISDQLNFVSFVLKQAFVTSPLTPLAMAIIPNLSIISLQWDRGGYRL